MKSETDVMDATARAFRALEEMYEAQAIAEMEEEE